MNEVVIAYVPALHYGYYTFLNRHIGADIVYVLASEVLQKFPHLRKDIRALTPVLAMKGIESWQIVKRVEILSLQRLISLAESPPQRIIMPDEDICHELHERFLLPCTVEFDNIFLLWDKTRTLSPREVHYDALISKDQLDHELMAQAERISSRSSDWWRRVGGIIARDHTAILTAFNQHFPTAHTPYIHGDPRSNFSAGINIELTSAEHAEAILIAEASKRGIALLGSDIYITTFPCPPCARLIGRAGIKRCFFKEGYSLLDAQEVLKSYNVQLFIVQ